jgi:hypothetical protein
MKLSKLCGSAGECAGKPRALRRQAKHADRSGPEWRGDGDLSTRPSLCRPGPIVNVGPPSPFDRGGFCSNILNEQVIWASESCD